MRKPYRSNKRFGAIVALVLALALAVIAPPVGQAAEVAPSVVGTRVEFGPGGGMVWADVESPPAGYPVSGHPSTINISGQTGQSPA